MIAQDFPVAVYGARRARLAAAIGDGVAVIPTAPERMRNRDTHYPYRHDSHFYYLTGFPEPQAALVVVGGEQPRSLLFCRPRDEERELWDGARYGPERARERFGVDEAHPIAALDEKMPELLADRPALHTPLGADPDWDARVMRWLNTVRARVRAGVCAPERVHDVRAFLDEMRLVKDAHELALMRRAAEISAGAHRRAMAFVRPGRWEYEVEAELLHEFRRHGARSPAYSPIVAGGANACVLHYVANDAPLREGTLLLVDAGCEFEGYAADITRTFPVGRAFSAEQRAIYELVLAAQAAALARVRAGASWIEPHEAAVRVLAQGLLDLGLLSGSLEEVLEKETYKRFYMHRTGHWLGMDVHDAGDYGRAGRWRTLEAGMVHTVEPGLYLRASPELPSRWHGIGVRIEDDVVVTADGCEVLTAAAPKSIADIEAIRRDAY
ncbi:MAG: aminopeptidase P N-terminal domain-containing protein [Burkholderiales bacterium]|nr:aminopeptidase P N-terminal domain-containing protein [Burkholderiales bacterium]